MESVDKVQPVEDRGEAIPVDERPMPRKFRAKPSLPVVPGLRPKQVLAAMMLVKGRMAKEVAQRIEVSPETVSRWRAQPEFQLLMRELLQESVEATKRGLVSLLPEATNRLGQVMFNMDDKIALKGINVLFSKAGPLLAAINAEAQRPQAIAQQTALPEQSTSEDAVTAPRCASPMGTQSQELIARLPRRVDGPPTSSR